MAEDINWFFYTVLSNAVTVNSLVTAFNDSLSEFIHQRLSFAYADSSLDKLCNIVFSILKRLMIVEMIWALLQLFGFFSLKEQANYVFVCLFIPQIIWLLFYILMTTILIRKSILKIGKVIRIKKKYLYIILAIISEPFFPPITDWVVETICKKVQDVLIEKENTADMFILEKSSSDQKVQGHDNFNKLRDKFNLN